MSKQKNQGVKPHKQQASGAKKYELMKKKRRADGDLLFCLDCFGDTLAVREGYTSVNGIEAVRFYLLQKHGWLPSQVISMSSDDLQFALSEEMSGYVLPEAARGV